MVKIRTQLPRGPVLPHHVQNSKSTGFTLIERVAKLVIKTIMNFWYMCGVAVLTIFLLYQINGHLSIGVLLVFAITALLYNASDLLLYHPDQPPHSRFFVESPRMYGLSLYENIFIRSKDGVRVNMILLKQPENYCQLVPTIVYLHGNAGNIGHRLQNAKGLFTQCGCNVLLLEWRGYGRSEGVPSEEGIYHDAQAAIDLLLQRPDIDRKKLIVFGRSLGGAVAIDLSARPYYCDKILLTVVENTFTSIPDMGSIMLKSSWIRCLPLWCFKNLYHSKLKISKVKTPTLFISGLADHLVPPEMIRELYELSGSSIKRLLTFEGGTHNETWMSPDYYLKINNFLDDTIFLMEELRRSQPHSSADIFESPPADDDVFVL
ncbi:PREDICTED: alpha/beta hydrolase domain-containing protein 13-like [Priapulus caudatus]|uniref:Alpha/beta hydrolase domain-containing protein 13-like n=1 Tax=Priapulus caudatus TaxID=37621 RepID=A0ABM1E5H2_PRICU|nr:PREDICTED: alpha/beta hydrolase domain-containing protein 13-like [Priapulus caudatus]XP_014667444.1 PREDICTED: alpha/beta hydrolase domain-containing protein 13-like [Priapulus caudatus]XP_014667445.1 PREDICTED: alpha/beta hydrolase domain-containing protein 13-like [Priapulus caudatus]XP_014667446.1 PREDICTED: alpha/beta hydrolase domain-containing protein 13-like [Priapulus caudatus]XP_014667447.1 PREDICTED: alpha/beta hydrolase domain-containing protein 13-like [Priapulus caudatus]